MEKEWKEFWATGKVKDYLAYKDCFKEKKMKEDPTVHETVNHSDRDGNRSHANI